MWAVSCVEGRDNEPLVDGIINQSVAKSPWQHEPLVLLPIAQRMRVSSVCIWGERRERVFSCGVVRLYRLHQSRVNANCGDCRQIR